MCFRLERCHVQTDILEFSAFWEQCVRRGRVHSHKDGLAMLLFECSNGWQKKTVVDSQSARPVQNPQRYSFPPPGLLWSVLKKAKKERNKQIKTNTFFGILDVICKSAGSACGTITFMMEMQRKIIYL